MKSSVLKIRSTTPPTGCTQALRAARQRCGIRRAATEKQKSRRTALVLALLGLCVAAAPLHAEASDPAVPNPRINPGWGNAERVCDNPRIGNDSPRLNFRGGRNDFPTDFYRIGRQPAGDNEIFLDIDATDPSAVVMKPMTERTARRWLITGVGAGLYQVSTCVDSAPRCLELEVKGEFEGIPRLRDCVYEALGTQVWWSVGSIIGDTAGGYELGNDGIGRMECLDVPADGTYAGMPRLAPCGDDTRDELWRVLPAAQAAVGDEEPPTRDIDEQPAEVTPNLPVQPKKDAKPARKTL